VKIAGAKEVETLGKIVDVCQKLGKAKVVLPYFEEALKAIVRLFARK